MRLKKLVQGKDLPSCIGQDTIDIFTSRDCSTEYKNGLGMLLFDQSKFFDLLRNNYGVAPLEEWKLFLSSLRHFQHEVRSTFVKEYGWSILTVEVKEKLGKFLSGYKSVIEVNAGSGYLASHLREASGLGSKYRAYDNCKSYWVSGRNNYGFQKANCFSKKIEKFDVVVLSWPPYENKLATKVLRKMVSGQIFIYQGEGMGGCCADDEFFDYLYENFNELDHLSDPINNAHVRWSGMRDQWGIFVKK